MTQLDRTFPTNNCDLCTLSPHLSESGRQLHIELLTMTTLHQARGRSRTVQGHPDDGAPLHRSCRNARPAATAIRSFPRWSASLPAWTTGRPPACAILRPPPMPFPSTWRSAPTWRSWFAFAPPGPFCRKTAEKSTIWMRAPSCWRPGAEVFDPSRLDTYGDGTYPNVVTSLEYERILSASGPTQGELLRPSDGKRPRKIAWIQCVGSRSLQEGCGVLLFQRLLHVRPEGSHGHPGTLP